MKKLSEGMLWCGEDNDSDMPSKRILIGDNFLPVHWEKSQNNFRKTSGPPKPINGIL